MAVKRADNISHEYQLENPMIAERRVVTKKNLSFADSFWIRDRHRALFSALTCQDTDPTNVFRHALPSGPDSSGQGTLIDL